MRSWPHKIIYVQLVYTTLSTSTVGWDAELLDIDRVFYVCVTTKNPTRLKQILPVPGLNNGYMYNTALRPKVQKSKWKVCKKMCKCHGNWEFVVKILSPKNIMENYDS